MTTKEEQVRKVGKPWRPYSAGDILDLGSGVTWKVSASLADFLNRRHYRARYGRRLLEAQDQLASAIRGGDQ